MFGDVFAVPPLIAAVRQRRAASALSGGMRNEVVGYVTAQQESDPQREHCDTRARCGVLVPYHRCALLKNFQLSRCTARGFVPVNDEVLSGVTQFFDLLAATYGRVPFWPR